MTKASYLQRGESLDYKNGTGAMIEAGSIILLVTRIGVAGTDIAPGEIGSIHVCGVFKVAKTKAADIPMGTSVYFDGTGITTDKNDGNTSGANIYTPAGYASADAAAADETILIKLPG